MKQSTWRDTLRSFFYTIAVITIIAFWTFLISYQRGRIQTAKDLEAGFQHMRDTWSRFPSAPPPEFRTPPR